MTGTRVEAGASDRPGCTAVGDGVSKRGAPVGSAVVGAGIIVNGGPDGAWTWVGSSILGCVGDILDGTGTVVPGGTVPKYGVLVEGPRVGVSVLGTSVPESTVVEVGSCTVVGIETTVEGRGA